MISNQRKKVILEKLAKAPKAEAPKAEASVDAEIRKNIDRFSRTAKPLGGTTLTKRETRGLKKAFRPHKKGDYFDRETTKALQKGVTPILGSEYRRTAAEKKGLGAYHDVQSGMTRPVEKTRTTMTHADSLMKRTFPKMHREMKEEAARRDRGEHLQSRPK